MDFVMNNITMTIIAISLWSPGMFFGYYVSRIDGQISLGQVTNFEWLVFWVLMSAPYFILPKIKIRDDDEN